MFIINDELYSLLLKGKGSSTEIRKWILDNYRTGTGTDTFVYQLIKDFLEITHTEELADATRKLVKATWFLAGGTVAAVIFGPEIINLLKCFKSLV